MPDPVFRFHYDFHPVSQGLFASGRLTRYSQVARVPPARERTIFEWIYDCGSWRQEQELAISRARDYVKRTRHRINLLTISHFDHDHVCALREILSRKRIDFLAIPYRPPAERLLILLRNPPATPDGIAWTVDPIGYVRSIAGRRVKKIILVLPDDPHGGERAAIEPTPTPTEKKPRWKIRLPDRSRVPNELRRWDDPLWQSVGDTEESVIVVDGRTPMTIDGLWEFLFYNPVLIAALQDDVLNEKLKTATKDFEGRWVDDKVPDANSCRDFIEALRDAYDETFGGPVKGPDDPRLPRLLKARNAVSLQMYSGPVGPANLTLTFRTTEYQNEANSTLTNPKSQVTVPYTWDRDHAKKVSVFYSGDIWFGSGCWKRRPSAKHPQILPRIREWFTDERIKAVRVLQVPHHAAKDNWFPGAVTEWEASEFVVTASWRGGASASSRHLHPHYEVLSDLATSGRMVRKCDGLQGVICSGSFHW